jgi:hypothetical protein
VTETSATVERLRPAGQLACRVGGESKLLDAEQCPATRHEQLLYDPDGRRLRA